MLTAATTQVTTGSTSSLTTSTPELGREDFLRMLIAQLENQDPLNPQESTEFTAQLAQFSSLEQEIAMRDSLGQISAAMARADSVTAIGMIGQEVVFESPQIQLGSQGAEIRFELGSETDSTVIEIQNERGSVVASVDLGGRPAGANSITWDGLGRYGNRLPAGTYAVNIEASAEETPVEAVPIVRSRVTGADVTGANPVLLLGDLITPLSSVREVRESPSQGAGS